MGVYINREMPESCSVCFVKDCAARAKNKYVMSSRGQKCPLVPVPPHGRLIDADALVVHKFDGAKHDISIEDGGACYCRGWNDAIEAIMENAKTIIGGE